MLAITKETGELLILRLKKCKNCLKLEHLQDTLPYGVQKQLKIIEIITIEQNPNKIKRVKENFQKAGISNIITIKEGMAIKILTELNIQEKYQEYFEN